MITRDLLINAVTIGIVTSLVASIFFLVLMFTLRNSLRISAKICKIRGENGEFSFYIKIINFSPLKLFDVRLDLRKIQHSFGITAGGLNLKIEDVKLKNNRVPFIYHYALFEHIFNKLWPARNCRLIQIIGDIESIWDGQTQLEFTLIARHSVSGFPKIKVKYYSEDCVHEGLFEHGLSTKIVPKPTRITK